MLTYRLFSVAILDCGPSAGVCAARCRERGDRRLLLNQSISQITIPTCVHGIGDPLIYLLVYRAAPHFWKEQLAHLVGMVGSLRCGEHPSDVGAKAARKLRSYSCPPATRKLLVRKLGSRTQVAGAAGTSMATLAESVYVLSIQVYTK